jgi:hypothetical protein
MKTIELVAEGYEHVGDVINCNRRRKFPLQVWVNYESGDMSIYDPIKKEVIYYEPMEERYQEL